jgi:hypothetical protein
MSHVGFCVGVIEAVIPSVCCTDTPGASDMSAALLVGMHLRTGINIDSVGPEDASD